MMTTDTEKLKMHENIFIELSVVVAIAAIVSVIMKVIRQPLIIGYILTGLIVGPSALNLIENNQTIDVFASLGVALLLFIIGLGLNPRVIKEVGRVAGIAGLLQVVVIAGIGYLIGLSLDYSRTESLLVGLALSFSSTIIVLKLLSDKKEQTRLNGKISIGILLVQDLVATLALVFVTARSEGDFSVSALFSLGLKGLALVLGLWLVSSQILQRLSNFISSSQELLFLFAIGWGFGIAGLFSVLGFSVELGALFAGVSLSTMPYTQEVSSRLRPLRDFFIVIFFIALGSTLKLEGLTNYVWPILLMSAVALLIKPLVFLVILGLSGYTKSTSFKVSTYLSQISEFSLILLILASTQGLIRPDIISIMTVVAFITIAVSAYTITYNAQLFSFFEKRLSLFERRKTKADDRKVKKYDMILFGYNKGGQEFVKAMKSMNKKYVVIDYDPEVIDLLENKNIPYIYGDVTDPELLEEVSLTHAKLVVSTVTDYDTNAFLSQWLDKINPSAVFVCTADSAQQASDLYQQGSDYVMLPHFVGSEKMSSFIKKNGFSKDEFYKFREKHLQYLETHYS
ncbi:cation:proton antiporter [Candidatus Saccharibacteria bacterium]|jgi:Kef-type K+ transport system membrane component KefB|nr:cation:proton antiporter [Candidatus Saccharibacteria bacterium]